MTVFPDSLATVYDRIRERIPNEYLNLICAQSDSEFDAALEAFLERAMIQLERNANFLCHDNVNEDMITAFLVAFLNMPGLRATQQEHTNGHVDITIEAEHTSPLLRRLGEAKIYDGPELHTKGLRQLVDRYSTGREGTGILLEYVKKPDIKNLVVKLRVHMDTNMPCAQTQKSQDHWIRWAFATQHRHSSGEVIRVIHLSCNLYRGNIRLD